MKYVFLVFLIMLSLYIFANPVTPEIFSELYVDGSSWWIELSPHWLSLMPGDSIRISNDTSSMQFCLSDSLFLGDCLVVNSSQYPSLQPPFRHLTIEEKWSDYWDAIDYNLEIPTSYPNNCITGQSLVYQLFGQFGDYFDFCAEASPTPGTNPNQVTTFGSINGFVRDHNLLPVPNARINFSWHSPIYSDATGYYSISELCGCQCSFLVHIQNTLYAEQDINIMPLQTLSHDFILNDYYIANQDQTQVSSSPIISSPNPIHAGEQIKFTFGTIEASEFILKIYNMKGETVSKLHCSRTAGEISYQLPSKLASGIYLYSLENEYKTFIKGKITVIE